MDKKFCPYCMNPVKEGESCTNCGLTEGVYTPRDHHLPLGTVLNNRYLIGRVLGEGGFGITYIGCDLNLEMKAAIKEYFPIDRGYRFSKASLEVSNYAHTAEKFQSGKAKFLREARTMARLDKLQNIVSVRDFFEENNTAYIVMEYVEGTTLKELVNQRGGRIPAGELLYMLEPLFPALTSVHEMGLIHRDISPDNLMLENGKIKLLDFGCARESAAQSETMTIALKQGYAPIEQYQHKGQGPWTDVYALSATIYYCLTGKTPQSAVDRLSEEELVPPRKLGVDLTVGQEAALLQGMNVKAKDRFQSVEELYAALYTNVMSEPAEPISAEPISAEPVSAEPVFAEPVLTTPAPAEQNSVPSVSELDSGSDQYVRNDNSSVSGQTDKAVILNSAEETNPPKLDQNEEKPAKKRILENISVLKQRLNRNLVMILAGCAALLVTVICIIWAVIPSKDVEETNGSGTNHTDGMATSTDDPQPGSPAEPEVSDDPQSGNRTESESSDDPVQEPETIENLFANAVVLEESSMEALQALMEDDTVSAIRLPEGVDAGQMYGTITITKPVLVEENAFFLLFDLMSVQGENACLWIEGKLGGDCILQTVDGGRVVADDSDCLAPSILWLEKEEDVRILNGGEPQCGNLIIGGKNTLFKNAVEVRDEASLIQAMDQNRAVIICEDITLKTDLHTLAPILIEEGVTVTMQDNGRLGGSGDDIFLWNEGKIQGELFPDDNTAIVNCGEVNITYLGLGRDAILINLGNLNLGDFITDSAHAAQSDSRGQQRIYNIGTLRFQSAWNCFQTSLTNYGSVFTREGYLCQAWIHNYGEFYIDEGSVILQSYLLNMSDGRIIVCDNAALVNRGVIEMYSGDFGCEPEGILNNEDGAVYCFYADPDISSESGWIHIVNDDAYPDRVCKVDSLVDLYTALQDPAVDKIYLTGTVEWNYEEKLTITKEVEISDGAQLLIRDGYELILDGGLLMNYGYMKVRNLTLTHGGSLRNEGTIEGYTLYTAQDHLIRLGNVYKEQDYNWTDCLWNEGTMTVIEHSWDIELYDNALMIQKGILGGAGVGIRGHAYFANMSENQWDDGLGIDISGKGQYANLVWQEWSHANISIDNGGAFRCFGELTIESGSFYVGQDGAFESNFCDIILGKILSVRNDGKFYIYQAGYLQGYLENHGLLQLGGEGCELVIDAPSGAKKPACLDNQGEVRVLSSTISIRCDNGEFIGNAAIYADN